ncbi:MAG TPA: hypothetical protein VFQ73_09920 [Flavisolibacter sp.]|nr:hypothetical protein [Flavisolibacter sp.]
MKRNFTNENFEDFLRQNADGMRMRPSDTVWKNISSRLNNNRRRIVFTAGIILLAISSLTYLLVDSPSNKIGNAATSKQLNSRTSQSNNSAKSVNKTSGVITRTALEQPGLISQAPISKEVTGESTPGSITTGIAGNLNDNFIVNEVVAFNDFEPTIVDEYPGMGLASTTQENQKLTTSTPGLFPLTIESVFNSYKPRIQKKKIGLQFYFTPTLSYRKLGENKSFLRNQSSTNLNYLPALVFDVNNVVTHKPDIGFEFGMAAKYPITKKMKVRAGVQFNLNRYDIKAYNTSTSVSTIMFNGRSNNSIDSMRTYTSYSTVNGYKQDWLQNYYVQISTPVGVEFKIAGNDKTEFGIATTVQPTYVLGDRAYIITTDYKRYAEVPQLVRRWNVNTSIETFVGYSTGKLAWQVGPQVRYQLLSSFVNKYPVKENLFDYGLKIGVSLNK